ncbi:HEPN domain-containing protein [Lacrimispora sp. NSJ-141]|uniref:HEPN domain-containing protein n=1 Tax=Lientehia hominis TaxID=2897778 RepID=A0AAP2WA19_9FIRM|nr:HEPN domain-containing protein [Lientehia hominis]MCD2492474.1 HEPN domain-containing protein [Lientehia hominis]
MNEQVIFKTDMFLEVKSEALYKPQMMDGLGDKTLGQYAPLTCGALAKPEYKGDMFEKEFISSFLESAKMLAVASRRDSVPTPGIYLFHTYSLVLPVLYMTRHCMELSIKRAIHLVGGNPKQTHKLMSLWSSFLSYLPQERNANDERILKRMQHFVRDVDALDDNGEKLRYPKGNDKQLTQDTFYWVNCVAITDALEHFVKQLDVLAVNEEKEVK